MSNIYDVVFIKMAKCGFCVPEEKALRKYAEANDISVKFLVIKVITPQPEDVPDKHVAAYVRDEEADTLTRSLVSHKMANYPIVVFKGHSRGGFGVVDQVVGSMELEKEGKDGIEFLTSPDKFKGLFKEDPDIVEWLVKYFPQFTLV